MPIIHFSGEEVEGKQFTAGTAIKVIIGGLFLVGMLLALGPVALPVVIVAVVYLLLKDGLKRKK